MRKTLKFALASLVIIGAGAFGAANSYHSHKDRQSKLILKNVEALTSGEGSTRPSIKCYTSLRYSLGAVVVLCSTCKAVQNRKDVWYNLADHCIPSY